MRLLDRTRYPCVDLVGQWLTIAGEIEGVQFVPVDNAVAVQSTRLPGVFHPDLADRIIVALARHVNAPLLTADEKIRSYRHLRTLW